MLLLLLLFLLQENLGKKNRIERDWICTAKNKIKEKKNGSGGGGELEKKGWSGGGGGKEVAIIEHAQKQLT